MEWMKLCLFIKSEVKMRLKKVCGFLSTPLALPEVDASLHVTSEGFPGIP